MGPGTCSLRKYYVSFDIPLSTIFWCFPSNSENLTDFRKTVETGMDPYLKLTLNQKPTTVAQHFFLILIIVKRVTYVNPFYPHFI